MILENNIIVQAVTETGLIEDILSDVVNIDFIDMIEAPGVEESGDWILQNLTSSQFCLNANKVDLPTLDTSLDIYNIGIEKSLFPGMLRYRRSYDIHRSKDHSTGNSLKTSGYGTAFLTENSTVVVAQIGGTAKLPCVVRKYSNGVVSWIRKKDSPPTILTVGVGTYIADDRFLVEHARHLQNWGLVIKHVRPSDAGSYECQVSSHPTTSIFIELRVTEASADIMGFPDLHIRAGSLLRLVCTLRHSTEPPAYVFWYHEQRMINHDPGVSVTADRASSVLQLEEADTSHNGNYTCYPSNAIPAYINVHVLNATEEENPAAMLHANSSDVSTALFISILLALFANILMTLDR